MNFPSDREYAELQKDADQRCLMRGNQGFIVFFRSALFLFLAIGNVILISEYRNVFQGVRSTDAGMRQALVFLLFWNLIMLAMIWLVSKKLATIKREKETEQNLAHDIANRAAHED